MYMYNQHLSDFSISAKGQVMRFLGQQLSNINLLGLEISISSMSNFYLDPEQVKVTACWRVGFFNL